MCVQSSISKIVTTTVVIIVLQHSEEIAPYADKKNKMLYFPGLLTTFVVFTVSENNSPGGHVVRVGFPEVKQYKCGWKVPCAWKVWVGFLDAPKKWSFLPSLSLNWALAYYLAGDEF
jgi:hypothetical protein